MKANQWLQVLGSTLLLCAVASAAEPNLEQAKKHVEAARAAAGTDHAFIFGRLCEDPIKAVGAAAPVGEVPGELPRIDATRTWYAEPVRVFDDLYFLGQTAFSVWALQTSDGIILVDSIFDYSVEAEVIGGLRKLGIDPAQIRYVIISHAHGDHSGGAGFLQRFGAKVVMSAADWDLYEKSGDKNPAHRDIVATDGMEIKLGKSTVRVYLTPGHTHGTISTVLPVHDGGKAHTAVLWGGTLFNFKDAPDDPRLKRLETYAASAARFGKVANAAGADILLSNHTAYDGSTVKLPALAHRQAGAPNPYVIGADSVQRYFKVAEQCAIAARLATPTPKP
ncbi:MAG TPA: MBL fold metallo-hydrolase [Steroidobacteraceae bacterium]|nr:MBL fold metallo-hydrolase [Steroidobacteraceae bacterium]